MSQIIPVLIQETALGEHDLRKIISNAPERYKSFSIKKRNGGGDRLVSQPARELKALQRALIKSILYKLPVHKNATAYVSSRSLKDNIFPHLDNNAILKFDFKNFFPSFTENDWTLYCKKHSLFDNEEDIEITRRILFKRYPGLRGLRLSIGAPSSPMLSNILMFDIDQAISEHIGSSEVVYTRYADDITFSAKRTGYLNRINKELRQIVANSDTPKLTINEEKTVMATKKYKRQVTGLIITNDRKASVGRDRKRLISAQIHRALTYGASSEEIERLLGIISFVQSIEPEFKNRMNRKYGGDVFSRLKDKSS